MAFQGTDGFSFYNSEGELAFRVDNYSRKHRELVLMDGAGKPLIALRPQVGFKRGDDGSRVASLFSTQISHASNSNV